jgi:DNA-directed RNA polymerase specialized sigma24 family protein
MLARWRRVRGGASPAGYAYRSAFRLLTRRRPDVLHGHAAAPQPGPEDQVVTRLSVEAAMAAMPPRRRACAVLCLVVGLTTDETASALGIAAGTVRKHLGEARTDLRLVL